MEGAVDWGCKQGGLWMVSCSISMRHERLWGWWRELLIGYDMMLHVRMKILDLVT